MVESAQLSMMATFVIVVFVVVALALVGVFAYTCNRASGRLPSRTRLNSNDSIFQPAKRARSTSTREVHPAGFKSTWGRRSLVESASMVTIQISPSRPAIFGDEQDVEGPVHVVLTPPTPAKQERRMSVSVSDSILEAYLPRAL